MHGHMVAMTFHLPQISPSALHCPQASCQLPCFLCDNLCWRIAPLLQPRPRGSVQPALSAVLKQGSFLLCGSQGSGSCPAPTTVSCGAPASLGFVSSAIKEAVTPAFCWMDIRP